MLQVDSLLLLIKNKTGFWLMEWNKMATLLYDSGVTSPAVMNLTYQLL